MLRTFSSIFNGQSVLSLDENESRHITCVLRAKKGAKIQILNGKGLIGHGQIQLPDKKATQIEILETMNVKPTECEISLLHAALTSGHTDFVVKEATALGVRNLWIFEAEHSESKLKSKAEAKLNHWGKLAIEACKQSGNPYLPNLYFAQNLYEIEILSEQNLGLFGHIDPLSQPLLKCLQETESFKNFTIAIGPEGDFSEKEKQYLTDKNFQSCSFGKNVLRAETAAIYALSVINSYFDTKNAQ